MISNIRRPRGFSLIELMIVLLIIAILTTIATQQYLRYSYRARRADGQELLMRVANAQERFYATFNRYGDDPVTGDLKLASVTSEKGFYTVTITKTDLTKDYTATAVRVAGNSQAKDVCGDLSINSAGVKLPAATDATKNSNGRCW